MTTTQTAPEGEAWQDVLGPLGQGLLVVLSCHYQALWAAGFVQPGTCPLHPIMALVLLWPQMLLSSLPNSMAGERGWQWAYLQGRHLARFPAVTLGPEALSRLFPGESSRFPTLVATQ